MDIYNSKLAKVLAWLVGKENFAITTSKNCTRYSCSKDQVDIYWRTHEDTHKKQFARNGWLYFVCCYILETFKNGYTMNDFEVEARLNASVQKIKDRYEQRGDGI